MRISKKILAIALSIFMAISMMPFTAFADGTIPSATVVTLDADEISNLNYTDRATGAQGSGLTLDYGFEFTPDCTVEEAGEYADYLADFVITADKDIPAGAVTLAGNYGSWGWYALTNDAVIPAGTEIRLLKTLLNEKDYTFREAYEVVNDFKCGVKLNDAAATGTTVNINLRVYESENIGTAQEPVFVEKENGEVFTAGEVDYMLGVGQTNVMPSATISELDAADISNLNYTDRATNAQGTGLTLQDAYEFTPDITPAEAGKYAKYNCDFIVSSNKDIPAGAITLAGNYGSWGWYALTNAEAIPAGTEIRLLKTLLGEKDYNYNDVYDIVQDFKCGIRYNENAVDGTKVDIDLRLFETRNVGTEEDPVYEEVSEGEGEVIHAGHAQSVYGDPGEMPTASISMLDASALKNLNYRNRNTNTDETGLNIDEAYEFIPNVTVAEAGKYANYSCDFVISADNDIPAGAITLSGNYGSFGWHAITNETAIPAGTEVRLLDTLLGEGIYTYADIYDIVQDFKCGVTLNDDAAAGTTVNIDLRLFETENIGTPDEPVYAEKAGGEDFSAADVDIVLAESYAADYATIELDGDIKFNFYIDVAFHNATKLVLKAVDKDLESHDLVSTEYDVTGENIYKVTTSISPAQLMEEATVEVWSGNDMICEYSLSPFAYLNDLIGDEDSSAELVNLCKALVNYAAASQKAVEWNDNNEFTIPVTSDTSVADVAPVSAASFAAISGVTLTSATVICKNETGVRFYYTGTVDSASVSGIPGAKCTVYDNAIDVTGIPADYIGSAFTLTINGTDIKYSVDSWSAAALSHFAGNAVQTVLAQSLTNYGAYAKAYFG